jgi:AraC-like DNA-binding protein
MWREQFARRWLSTDLEPLGADHITSEISSTDHSFLGLCKMRSTPVRFERRNDASHVPGTRYLILASGSPMQVRQRGRSIDLSLGQMVLMSADEPAQVAQLADGGRWSIRMSVKLLGDICRNVEEKMVRPVNASHELAKLLLQQIETAHRFGSKLDAFANHVMAQHVFDLIALCLGANADAAHFAAHRGLAAARLDAIKGEILRRLTRPDMTLGRIAAGCDLSTRYVQHLFELSGMSFTGFVLEHRLLLAHRLLRDPVNHWRKVSDIANTAGFSDVSYFNRAFKSRFGETPTDVRARVSFENVDGVAVGHRRVDA